MFVCFLSFSQLQPVCVTVTSCVFWAFSVGWVWLSLPVLAVQLMASYDPSPNDVLCVERDVKHTLLTHSLGHTLCQITSRLPPLSYTACRNQCQLYVQHLNSKASRSTFSVTETTASSTSSSLLNTALFPTHS